jgi:hypothetical protein
MLRAWLALLCLCSTPSVSSLQIGLPGRRALVSGAAVAGLLLPSGAAWAGDEKSKYQKKFVDCVSACIYDRTKIAKGLAKVEVIPRDEAAKMCKQRCATSKEQLLSGKPKPAPRS